MTICIVGMIWRYPGPGSRGDDSTDATTWWPRFSFPGGFNMLEHHVLVLIHVFIRKESGYPFLILYSLEI